jgi:hypothetical protein
VLPILLIIGEVSCSCIKNSFDFIHARNISQGICDWPTLMAQIYNCTKPGGWAQLAEIGCDSK